MSQHGLTVRGGRTLLTIAGAAATIGLSAQQATAPAAAPAGSAPEEDVVVLSPFEVVAANDTGYRATETLAGTRIRTDLRDVGSAITVLTKDFLNDIGATDNTTLLQYTPNAEVGGTRSVYAGNTNHNETASLASPSTNNRVRGLSQADNTRDFFVTDIPWDSFNVDRIDVQRGPNSILFGLGKPAGMVNATLQGAEFRNVGTAEYRTGSYGSQRASLNLNQQLIDKVLAIRVAGLWDHEKFRQKPAFEKDERLYATVRFDPQIFKNSTARTSFRVKFEHGEIDANRPRTLTPYDRVSAWFRPLIAKADIPNATFEELINSGMGRFIAANPYDTELDNSGTLVGTTTTNPNPFPGGDGKGQMKANDPDFNGWLTARGNQQQPAYFIDGATNQLYSLYGGFVNKGARESSGAVRASSSSLVGLRYSDIFYGTRGLSDFASNSKIPGNQYGQYRDQSMTDASIFDFYNTLIDGPNKWEREDWDAYSMSFSQTAWGDRLGLELNYDRQEYKRANQSLLGYQPSIDIDVLGAFQDLKANSNVGRPYVTTSGSGASYESTREYMRASVFAEFRAADVFDSKFLQRLIGRHRFNGVLSDETYTSENRSWNMYGTTAAFDTYTGASLAYNERPPYAIVYLGQSIKDRPAVAGADIPGIQKRIDLNDGNIYTFSSQWNASNVAFGDAWAVPAAIAPMFNTVTKPYSNQDGLQQASNPANYVGWNSNYTFDIARYEDGDESLTTNAQKARRKVRSYAGSWQSYWWDGAVVGTLGWRFDDVRSRDVTAVAKYYDANATTADKGVATPRGVLNLNEGTTPHSYSLPDSDTGVFKDHSLSWGGVLHLNKLLKKDPLPINISLSYNTSDNFEVAGTRRNMMGDVLVNPTGKTKDYGVLLSTKDGKYSFRVVKYEASVQNASTDMGGMQMFGDIISYGLRWRNVFLYNLNTYTLDSANGSNEWRYNFDPDTAAGETQEQATAREDAAIAAWNEIQAHLPAKFYNYWGFTPPSNLANPASAEVQPYKLWGSAKPAGFTVTSDTVSKGYEFEFTANPLPNWRVMFNASKTTATRNNVGGAEELAFVEYMNTMLAGPAGQLRMFSGGPTADTLLKQWNSYLGNWTLLKLQEGAQSSEIRKWRYSVVTNYTFTSGFLKNVGVGASYRWQDKIIIGYPVVPVTATQFSFDLNNPYYGPAEDAVDAWLSYEHKLTAKINWKIQLNVRNLFADDGVIPVTVQPDGKTWASVRVKPNREWFLTNTFSF